MAVKIDLETNIYLILCDEEGYAHGELSRVLNEDGGNLSKKLKELREKRKTIYRTSQNMDDPGWTHYIKDDIDVFEYILKKLTKNLRSFPPEMEPSAGISIIATEYTDNLLFEDYVLWGDPIFSLSYRICRLINKFIKSEYTLKIIKKYGFEPTYSIFKEETHGYCDIMTYIELAEDLRKQEKMSNEDFGKDFLADREKRLNHQ